MSVTASLNPTHNPKVSIIMNCFNGVEFIKEAIDSVIGQTYQNWELIFWDNQSTDGSGTVVQEYHESRIRYFSAKKFTSLGKARNLALSKTKGDLIAFLDCDDLWLPEKLSRQVPLFEKKEIGIVICDTIFFNNSGKQKQLYKKTKPPEGNVFKDLLDNYFISLETVVVRSEALKGMKELFDIRFDAIEEYDVFIRLCYRWELAYVDQILAKWRVHNNSVTWTRSNLFGSERRLFLEKINALIPQFHSQYLSEYRNILRKCDYEDAKEYWQSNNSQLARKILAPHRFSGIKWLLIYLLTFFPFPFFRLIEKIGRVRP